MTDLNLPTAAQVAKKSASEIVTTYNRLAPAAGWGIVKRFSSSAAGTKRLTALLAELRVKAPAKAVRPLRRPRSPRAGTSPPACVN